MYYTGHHLCKWSLEKIGKINMKEDLNKQGKTVPVLAL